MLTYGAKEKRVFPRICIKISIICEIADPETKTIKKKIVLSKDISPEGVYFEVNEMFPLGTQINATFQLPKSNSKINAALKIVRIETTEKENKFGIAAIFIQIADKDRQEIKHLVERLNINRLLELTIKKDASDLHLVVDQPPVLRIHGELTIMDMPRFSAEEISNLLFMITNDQQRKTFEATKELDFGIQYDLQNRFRINLHQQKGYPEAAFRLINTKISSFAELNLPETVKDLARLKEGLVVISGPTGSGKTTTIAAMVELINQERKDVIVTLERPIEYVYSNAKSIIKQREVGIDTGSFSVALRSSLRQDPNVIVVGELDDTETVRTALIAAESGYLVIVSFHAPNTIQAIDRLANIFPVENRRQVLSQVSHCLKGVVTQLLIPPKEGGRRLLATEIILTNDAVRRIIRNDELVQLPNIIQTGASQKMQAMVSSIKNYVERGLIDTETATFFCDEFTRYVR